MTGKSGALFFGLVIMVALPKIDSQRQIQNPSHPRKGTIVLEVEKILTINPYVFPDFGMSSFSFVRSDEGSVILYNSNKAAVHLFGNRGQNLGPIGKTGQGPGEFIPPVKPFFSEDRIWIASPRKLISFDSSGRYLEQRPVENRPEILIDENRHLTIRSEWDQNKIDRLYFITLRTAVRNESSDNRATDLFGPVKHGISRKNGLKFIDSWGTPEICFGYDQSSHLVFAAVNREYRISVLNLSGKTIRIIQKTHVPVKTDLQDIEAAYLSLLTIDPAARELLDIYPKTYAAIKNIQPLKNGYLLVFRITGMRKLEIDVFDPEGVYVYALRPPEGLSFEHATFHGRGFAVIEHAGDSDMYSDYRVTNLPEIFR